MLSRIGLEKYDLDRENTWYADSMITAASKVTSTTTATLIIAASVFDSIVDFLAVNSTVDFSSDRLPH